MLDIEELGIATADLMDTLEAQEGLPDEVRLEEVMIIAAVSWPVNEEGVGNSVFYRCSSSYPWVQKGLLEQAHHAVDRSSKPYEEDEDK